MTNAEAVEILKSRRKCAEYVDCLYVDSVDISAIDMAIAALEKQEGKKPITVETNIYDTEEIHHGCTVQVLRNSVTGDVRVGWWKEEGWVIPVRCQDCKWFGLAGCAIQIVDDTDKPSEDDFCSFGERKGGNE